MNALTNQHRHTHTSLLALISSIFCKSKISTDKQTKLTGPGKGINAFVSFKVLPGATVALTCQTYKNKYCKRNTNCETEMGH